ncbi:MAG: superoxide dismutase [Rickettsiales bacterium]|nr:MAG: superoxide dismutase [Rickettsiales bacterium]
MTFCNHSNQKSQPFTLPKLPFDKGDFQPDFTTETFDYHYDKHHNAYVTNLNNLLKDNSEFDGLDLEQIINKSHNNNASIFNNAAQVWNHSFFWNSIKPKAGGKPSGKIGAQIEKDFGSYDDFATEFKQAAVTQFGSGWAWLVYCSKDQKLKIVKTGNAETPITQNLHPLIACDVWEHAYYIDYRNKRPDYVSIFIERMINWEFAEMHLELAKR